MADTTMQVAMDRIHVIPGFNARLNITPESVAELADNIKEQGLINPITLRPMKDREGHYDLIAGHRRYAAHELLKKQFIFAHVKELSDKQAAAINLSENVSRRNLTPYEIARKCQEFRDKFHEKGNSIAAMVGDVSKSYVNNLLRVLDHVDPRIIKAWEKGDNVATVDFLVILAKHEDHAKQWEMWSSAHKALEQVGADALGNDDGDDDDDEGGEGGGKGGEGSPRTRNPKRPRLEYLNEAVALVRRADAKVWKGADPAEIAIACLNFARGVKPRITVGEFAYDPKAEPEGAEEKPKKAKADKPPKAKAKAKDEGKPKAVKAKADKPKAKAKAKSEAKPKGEAQPSA